MKNTADGYLNRLPEAKDALLLIEVSGTTLKKDKEVKLPLYAAAGIPECWIINIEGEQIEKHTHPSPKGCQ